MKKGNLAIAEPPPVEDGVEVDIRSLADQIVADRKSLASAKARKAEVDEEVSRLRIKIKESMAALIGVISEPRKKREAKDAAEGPEWPLPGKSTSQTRILKELDDIGPMSKVELSKALPEISSGALNQALYKLMIYTS